MNKKACFLRFFLALLLVPFPARPDSARMKIELGVSIPSETGLDDAGLRNATDIWRELIDSAQKTIDLAQFYLVSRPGSRLQEIVTALERAAKRGVKIRILAEKKMQASYSELLMHFTETPNMTVRLFDWRELSGGILHAKYFIVDGRQCWVGSQNFDWRALEQIHETGARIDDSGIAAALSSLFQADWDYSGGDRNVYERLKRGPAFSFSPEIRLCASPAAMLPPGMEASLQALTGLIDGARKSLTVQLLSYSCDGGEFTVLQDALMRAAARGVKVRLLVSDWSLDQSGQSALKKLVQVAGLQVRVMAIPQLPSGFIPFARVHHSKVLRVDDQTCVVSTSNWSADYFLRSRNVEVIFNSKPAAISLDRLFTSLWQSPLSFVPDPDIDYQPPARQAPTEAQD